MKTRYLAIFVILALAGCSRINPENVSLDGGSLRATIDGSVESTKAILVDNPGVRMQSKWQGGDCIGVFGNCATNIKFSITEADISEDGKTAKFNSTSDIPSGEMASYSPWQEGASVSSDAISITFPASQTYSLNDGIVQPDPKANIMMGSGSASNGITFRNAMAVLKIGQVFNEATVVKSVVFRDLSGKAVSGTMTLKWHGGQPLAEITGSGSTITLDCGEGVSLDKDQLGVFFLFVPARSYANGFELTFVTGGGAKTVKTVGTAQGKTLDRSVVYLIGDITSRQYIEGASSQLNGTAQVMTAEKLDKVKITSTSVQPVYDDNGKKLEDCNGNQILMPQYGMLVHKDLNPVEGGWFVFEEETDDLSGGGVYRITSCRKTNDDYYEVVAKPETQPWTAFKSVVAGKLPTVDASGNIVEDNGLPLDITSYVKSIVDESGNELYIQTNSSGELVFSEDQLQNMVDVATKATRPHSRTFNSPKLSGNLKSDNAELSFGASMTFNTRLALGVMQGELQYACLNVNPQITVSESLTIKSEVELEKNFRIFTLTTHPIPVALGVAVVVEIVFNASLGVGGDLQITASAESTTDLGTYSVSYNIGDGVIFRNKPMEKEVPGSMKLDLSGFEGSVYGKAGIGAKTSVSIWGLCGLGVSTDYTMKCGFFSEEGKKFALQPEIEFTPALSTFFWSHKFEDLTAKIELDPIWESYIIPPTKVLYIIPSLNWTERYYDITIDETTVISTPVSTSVKGIEYSINLEGQCYDDLQVVLLVFKGSGIKYVPQDPDDPDGAELNAYKTVGVGHLYPLFYMCDKKLENPAEKPDQVLEIGTYPKDSESKKFEGICTSGTFSQGQAYGVVPAVKIGDYYNIISTGSSGTYYNPFIYWWPNRSNGAPYFS